MQISTDGARINVRVDGDATTPLVLLHGFPFYSALWDGVASELARDARIVRIDLRGCGASSVAQGPYLMDTLAGDVAAVLDALGIERATIAGHSMGGYVAMAFARMYSERVSALALICSSLAADSDDMRASRYAMAQRAEESHGVREIVETYATRVFAPQTRDAHPQLVDEAIAMMERIDPMAAAALLRGMALRDSCYDIATDLTMPVAVIAGALDPLVPAERSKQTAAAFPSATLTVLDGSDHLPMLEEPAAVAGALRALLQGAAT